MKNINPVAGHKLAIQAKQFEHSIQEKLMIEQFFVIVESLKSVNLSKSTLS